MRRTVGWASVFAGLLCCAISSALAAEIAIYGFEGGVEGWVVPDWAKLSNDYALKGLSASKAVAQEGTSSLELQADFPGGRWTGAYVERETEVRDWTQFRHLSVSLYVPPEAPTGLKSRIILTIGEAWQWTEMNRAVPLQPGAWTTITVDLTPTSMNWKFFVDESFRKDIRKIGIRVESDTQPVYRGAIFVDNVCVAE